MDLARKLIFHSNLRNVHITSNDCYQYFSSASDSIQCKKFIFSSTGSRILELILCTGSDESLNYLSDIRS